jgi:hypothetical protein
MPTNDTSTPIPEPTEPGWFRLTCPHCSKPIDLRMRVASGGEAQHIDFKWVELPDEEEPQHG